MKSCESSVPAVATNEMAVQDVNVVMPQSVTQPKQVMSRPPKTFYVKTAELANIDGPSTSQIVYLFRTQWMVRNKVHLMPPSKEFDPTVVMNRSSVSHITDFHKPLSPYTSFQHYTAEFYKPLNL
jgi:hypothetical protein